MSYYHSEEDALARNNPITAMVENDAPYQQKTIWARIDNTQGCFGENITSFTLNIIPPVNISHTTKITDFQYRNNAIEIIMDEPAEDTFEFSVDGIHYFSSPVFEGLVPGVYTVYIRTVNGCKNVSEEVVILAYPKFFTPNLDGTHEYWNIFYINNFPDAKISIFDRYGKLLNRFFGYQHGWNGTYNGINLPATDYWFCIDFKNGRTVKGHFALVR